MSLALQTLPSPASAVNPAQSTADALRTERLHKAAHQFEAMLLGEMLKPLSQAGEDALNESDSSTSSGPLQSFGVEAVAGSLANSNALGFAKQIERALAGHRSGTNGVQTQPNVSKK